MKYKIVADSSANLQSFEDVDFAGVPLKVIAGDREFTDVPGADTTEMTAYLSQYKGRSTTSCPNVADWMDAFGDADRVFAISITSSLSGCYNASVQAKAVYEETHPDRKVCCLDSLSTGPEMVLLAEKIRDLIQAGLEFEEIEVKAREYLKTTRLLFSLDSLHNLARNGRCSPLLAKAAGLLGIRLIGQASDHGELQPMHKARGMKQAMSTIFREMKNMGCQGGRIRIAHCFNPEAAGLLRQLIMEAFPQADVVLMDCGVLCCFYAEKGGLMVSFEI